SSGEAVLTLAKHFGYPIHEGRALWFLGRVAYAQGQFEEAESLLERGLSRWLERSDTRMAALVLAELGRVARQRGQPRTRACTARASRAWLTGGRRPAFDSSLPRVLRRAGG